MVKGKDLKTKNSQTQKTVEQQKSQPVTKTATTSRTNRTDKQTHSHDIPLCSGCRTSITDDVRALQCEKGNNCKIWKCAECLSISQELYDQLTSDDGARLRWFCDQCDKSVTEETVDDKTLCSRMEALLGKMENILGRVSDVEKKLEAKADADVVSELTARVCEIEEQLKNNPTSEDSELTTQGQQSSSQGTVHSQKLLKK